MSDSKKIGRVNVLEKIMTLIRSESQFLRDTVMDGDFSRNLEAELDDATFNLKQAKSVLSEELNNQLQSSRLVKILDDKINQQEQLIINSLSEGDEERAFLLATEVVDLEQDRAAQNALKLSHERQLGYLQAQLENAERSLKDVQRRLTMVNTTERIQKATAVINKNFEQADAKMLSAKKTLQRIRSKQQQLDNPSLKLDASNENSSKMALQGITNNKFSDHKTEAAAAVLKRIINTD